MVPRIAPHVPAEVPDPRSARHALVVVLALTACAVPAGATLLSAIGEWITDAPPRVLRRLGVRIDPLAENAACPRRRPGGCRPVSTATRRTRRWTAGGALRNLHKFASRVRESAHD
ncbi:transposase family protein [Streptomyces sp. AF1A]|uniref:transposase family protein n=1 Tax=Streptomyces sp. AF1A TaxID=3394350 RepID=UPI0039BD09FD